ncbi:MAG: DUF6146 family protein [Bacteroidota bacterium]|jgi:hypothetical protein|nr:DUF6146 family protein [Bacteroidota bacterium]HHU95776.1 hypothetical protein [Petrimonas sp.]
MKPIKREPLLYMLVLMAAMAACSGPKGVVAIEPNGGAPLLEDSISYELIVLDPGFESWYLLHGTPTKYRSQSYYENWNHRYVSEWNHKATSPGKHSFFQPIHGYEQGVDYGFELNHKLFYYFQYVERELKIPILVNRPATL